MEPQQQDNNHNNLVEYTQQRSNGTDENSSIKIRLDVSEILQEFEMYLRGLEINYFKEKGKELVEPKLVPMGKPKLNNAGIKALLAKARAIINKSVFQGNLEYRQWLDQIKWIRYEIAELLYINFHHWKINLDNDINEITDTFMNTIENVLTRSIDNEERKGFSNIMTSERTVTDSNQGGFRLFGGNK